MNFVAVDVETASEQWDSTCAIAIAVVEDGQVTENRSWLIRPRKLQFNPRNVSIHGIDEDAVRCQPELPELWPILLEYFNGKILAAHNASFDFGVLARTLAPYGLPFPNCDCLCTVELARCLLPGLPNHRLRTLAAVFGITLSHHDPKSDALVCAELAIRLMRLAGPDLESLLHGGIDGYRDSSPPSGDRDGEFVPTSVDLLMVRAGCGGSARSSVVFPARLDGRFQDKRFVFTGELTFLSRDEAMAIVEAQGGRSLGSVSKKTDFLVVGGDLLDQFERTGVATSKLRKAIEVGNAGYPIRVLDESAFLAMIT